MTKNNKVMCPDCGHNEITMEYLQTNGRCISCIRRKRMMEHNGTKYVPITSLSQEQQEKLNQKRLRNNKSTKDQFIQNARGKKLTYTLTPQLKSTIESCIDKKYTVLQMLNEIHKTVPEYSKMSQSTLYKLLHKDFKYFKGEEPVNNTNTNAKQGKSKIITPELQELLDCLVTEELYFEQIWNVVQDRVPGTKITQNYLRNYLTTHHKGYKRLSKKQVRHRISEGVINKNEIKNETKPITDLEISDRITNTTETSIELPKQEVNTIQPLILSDIPEQTSENRFINVIEEVNNTTERKFKLLNCYLPQDFNTNDYIEMLNNLLYLATNTKKIFDNRVHQEDVMNAYQADIVHEIEQEVSKPGDTYFQDKLHILREKRRRCKFDAEDIDILKPFLDTIDIKQLQKVLSVIENKSKQREGMYYIPVVDMKMNTKYKWAKMGTIASTKNHKRILTSRRTMKSDRTLRTYRVNCKLSGGGFGAYHNWYRDYQVANPDIAMSYAYNELAQLAKVHQGMVWTQLTVHQVNR